MNRTINKNLSKLLWALIIVQIVISLFITGRHVMFNSSLRLWLNQDYFLFQKLQMMLGGDYQLSQQLASIPEDAGILVVRPSDMWFINYYMLPRRMYLYPTAASNEANNMAGLKKVPAKWIKEREIEYVLFYGTSEVRIWKVGKDIQFR